MSNIYFVMNSIRKAKYVSSRNSMFHVNLPKDYEERGVDIPDEEEVTEPDLFPGEIVIASANNVLKFSLRSEQNTGISGTLYITNLRLTLHTTLPPTEQEEYLHHHTLSNLFLGPHDIELSLIASVQLLDEQNQQRKSLQLGQALPDKIPGIQLLLKNFRVVNLSFKFSPPGEECRVLNALLHHGSPASVDLLFLTPGRPPPASHIPTFRTCQDWQCELERTRCPGWRVTQHNEHYNLCATLPPAIVVPASMLDADVERAGHQFREGRAIVWVWGASGGAALVIMAQVSPNIPDTVSLHPRSLGRFSSKTLTQESITVENSVIRAVHRSHPQSLPPVIIDLDRELPQPLELYNATNRLRKLHLPEVVSSSYHSQFEGTRWLNFVSTALRVASEAAQQISIHNRTVILQEGSGRDAACVVSSLVEVMCDPYARTIRGLHSVIAKHWVALGHPFTTRLGHTRLHKHLQGPCLLLLLDCLQQLCRQQPHLIEYSPHYLSALWTAAHSPLYSTCFFDSTNNRHSTISVLLRENRSSVVDFWEIWCWWSGCGSFGPSSKGSQSRKSSCTDAKINGSSDDKPPSGNVQSENEMLKRTECSESCKVARRSFISPLYVHQLFLSLLPPGAVDRIKDTMSIAHHTWQQIKRLLFPSLSQHLPYNISYPPIYPTISSLSPTVRPNHSQLPPPLRVETNIPRLQPWVELFGQWLPHDIYSGSTRSGTSNTTSTTKRKLALPDNPDLLFWPTIYDMYHTVDTYLKQQKAPIPNGL